MVFCYISYSSFDRGFVYILLSWFFLFFLVGVNVLGAGVGVVGIFWSRVDCVRLGFFEGGVERLGVVEDSGGNLVVLLFCILCFSLK